LQAVNGVAVSRVEELFYNTGMPDTVTVISLGGSIIAPRGIDTAFLKGFLGLVEEHMAADQRLKLIIVCGGAALRGTTRLRCGK
jgi:uridylate kinase